MDGNTLAGGQENVRVILNDPRDILSYPKTKETRITTRKEGKGLWARRMEAPQTLKLRNLL